MGMIYKRGNTWWIKYYRNGKCFRESSGTTKKMVAKKLMDRREGEIAQGKVPSVHFEKVTFDELAEDFLRDYRINQKKSLKRAERSVAKLNETFEGLMATGITTVRINHAYPVDTYAPPSTEELQEVGDVRLFFDSGHQPSPSASVGNPISHHCWFCAGWKTTFSSCMCQPDKHGINKYIEKRLNEDAANATINRELSALKRILNLGREQTPPLVDRLPYIPMLKENNARKGFFEHGEFLALCDTLPYYLKDFITFAYKTGWRISEIAKLRNGDEITSPSRRIDLGQICSILNHKS